MSIPYIALYPGDFLADTGHLGNTELGIYWRLLLVYYRDARPLPVDMDRLRRLAMTFSPEECRALESVLPEFFILTTKADGTRCWHHKRADIELTRATSAHNKKSEAAKVTNAKRWGKGSLSDSLGESLSDIAKRPKSDGEPEPEPEPEPEKKKEIQAPRKRSTAPSAPDGVTEKVWADWLAVRKAKKAAVTDTALGIIKAEADKAGYTMQQALETCCSRGWSGFKAEWVADADQGQPRRQSGIESFRAQDERIAAESVRRLTGGLAHNRAAVGEAPPRELLPFERGYVAPAANTIEGNADVRRIR